MTKPNRVKGGAIYRETILHALINDLGNKHTTTPDLRKLILPPKNYDLGGRLHTMVQTRILEKIKIGSGNGYRATKEGKALLKQLSHSVQTYGDYCLDTIGTGPRQMPLAPAPAAPVPLETNISASANILADNITAVIEENQQYRNLLLNVYTTIGKALGLDKENNNGSGDED